ncbi:MAG: homocysteine S-methyltransferase [Chloroflexota bacterium]
MEIDPLIAPFLQGNKTLILDGGLATELEDRGFDLDHDLWSAKILIENPDAIKQLHLDYLYAGADCIITATYQATIQGLKNFGLSHEESIKLMQKAVDLAIQSRNEFWEVKENRKHRIKPLVAASVGPYGAYLADGSEYSGQYGLTVGELIDFHTERWDILAKSGADFLLCETTPSIIEARAYAKLLNDSSRVKAAISFSCLTEDSICDETKIKDFELHEFDYANFISLGINCTSPKYMPSLIQELQKLSQKPVMVYPNSGEEWDEHHHCWTGVSHPEEFGTAVREWRRIGAALIGGCCRTGPKHIQAISSRLRK